MNDQQINEAIAEACGWEDKHSRGLYWNEKEHRSLIARGSALHEKRKKMGLCREDESDLLPSYTTDLNAIAPVLKAMDYQQRMRFGREILKIMNPKGELFEESGDDLPALAMYFLCNINPNGLSQAAVRAFGKWREE